MTLSIRTVMPAVAMLVVATSTRAADVDFVKEIKPILERACLKCHGPVKPKGGLRLDTREALIEGAKSGKIVEVGKADDSRLYEVIIADKDDPDRMPAEGDMLNKLETELFRDWINQGVKWPDNLVLVAPERSPKAEPEADPGLPISDAEKAAVAAVQKQNALAMRLAQNTNLIRIDYSLGGKEVKDADLAVLKDIANLVELNLGGTQISDAGAAHLKPLTNVTRLQLHKTKITDSALENLKGMQKLNSLNLYGTEVTDKGLEHLKGLASLKKLYVWQSKVTPDGAKMIGEAIPGLAVEMGYDPKPPEEPKAADKTEEKKEEKKDQKPVAKKAAKKDDKEADKKDDKKEDKKEDKK